ncbi:MarC family protein [Saccharospirillum sp. HFRX-1]|uniref:MarC family protein n=1 Tax=unclassified Saccharospirillum TaxID=2633430 RepID=UPI00371E2922
MSTAFLNALASFFVVIDPIGTALIFYSLTVGRPFASRFKTLIKATAIAASIILLFAWAGETLLTALGISMDALRVAGGILLFNTAFRMITSAPVPDKPTERPLGDISVYPLAIPLMSGPGTLTLTVLLMADAEGLSGQGIVIAAAMLVLAVTMAGALMATQIRRLVGKTGDDIIQRLLGVILAALAIQFVANGINGLF